MKTIPKMVKALPIILTIVCVCGFMVGHSPVLANDQYENRIDRVDEALRDGRISLKISVLQKAKILFSPHRALLEGEDIGDETPRLELFEDVRRVFETLTTKDKSSLRSLSPELARVINEEESGGQPQRTHVSQSLPTTFHRVAKAYDHGEMGLKEAVLLKARLLFVPHTIDARHLFSVKAGEVPVDEPCLTGFYRDVHRVFDELAPEEISFLGSLSPDLKVIMTVRGQERAGMGDPSRVLPIHADLNQQEEGSNCIVHYALNGANAAPNKSYAVLVKVYMDMAIKSNMATKHFTKAYADGYADFAGKMHVYIVNLGPGTNGSTVPVGTGNGNKMAAYINIHNALDTKYGGNWQLKLKGVSFHEYFHGIQGAYNWDLDDWCAEATSVWASCYYGKDWAHLGGYYTSAGSIFNTPNENLWATTDGRTYSTSALAFYLSDKFAGHEIIKSWMVKMETDKDSIKTLEQTLNTRDTAFTEEYISFLASLYAKSIKSIKKYMPDVAFQTEDEVYGLGPRFGDVHLTGANFHLFNPQAGAQPGTFISTLAPGGTGVPKGVLVQKKGTRVSNPMAFRPVHSSTLTAYVGGFGKSIKQVALIVTDATYSAKDTTLRSYDYTAIVPSIVIHEVTAQSPIYSGDSSQMGIRYDLTGTFPGKLFPVYLKLVEKGPGVADYVSGELNFQSGVDQIRNLWFNTSTSTHGNYKFAFQLAVPPDSWLPIPQVSSKGKCSVRVEEPSRSATARQTSARESESATLTIKK